MKRGAVGDKSWVNILVEILLIALALIFLYPIFFLFIGGFKEPAIFYDPFALPASFYLGSFKVVFEKVHVLRGFSNTVIVVTLSLFFIIDVGSLAGYAIARVNNRWFKFAYFFFLAGMVIPLQTTMVTLFKLGVSLFIMDTHTFLVLLYVAGSIPISTFLYVGFMKSIPKEIEESAFIDGCGPARSFARIVFPLLMLATGTLIILNVTGIYNDFLSPLLYLRSEDKLTLMPQIVQFYANKFMMDFGPVFALSSLAVLPLIVLFIFTQKYMIKGLIVGALKG